MNIKLKAALQTVGILAVITSISIGVQLLVAVLTAQELSTLLAVISITFLIFGMYQMVLGRLEYNQKVDALTTVELQSLAKKYFNMQNYIKAVLNPEK